MTYDLTAMLPVDNYISGQLKNYVYLFRNPTLPGNPIVYVGIGGNDRFQDHLDESHNDRLNAHIAAMRERGIPDKALIDIYRYDLDRSHAEIIEAVLIQQLKPLGYLLNKSPGHLRGRPGRNADELIRLLRKDPVRISESGIIVFIERSWQIDMSASDLAAYSRGYWHNIGKTTRRQAKVLISAAGGLIRGAWKIVPDSWMENCPIEGRDPQDHAKKRWSCEVTVDPSLEKYINEPAPKGTQQGWRLTPI